MWLIPIKLQGIKFKKIAMFFFLLREELNVGQLSTTTQGTTYHSPHMSPTSENYTRSHSKQSRMNIFLSEEETSSLDFANCFVILTSEHRVIRYVHHPGTLHENLARPSLSPGSTNTPLHRNNCKNGRTGQPIWRNKIILNRC